MTDPFRARPKPDASSDPVVETAPASEAAPADGEVEARRSELDDMTKAELQKLARDLHVSEGGSKAALMDRIVEAEKRP